MRKYDLSGSWGFLLDEERVGIEEGYFLKELEDRITLPSTTAIHKKGKYNTNRESGYLTEEYPFEGYAWYQKKLHVDKEHIGKPIRLYLERSRITHVWIDDKYVGAKDSLCAPHCYMVGDYITKEDVTVTVLVNNADYVTKGGHLTSPDTQTNWNGILGRMELQCFDCLYIEQAQAKVHRKEKKVGLTLKIMNHKLEKQSVTIAMVGDEVRLGTDNTSLSRDKGVLMKQTTCLLLEVGENDVEVDYMLYEPKEWDEYSPVYYELALSIDGREADLVVPFGVRDFEAKGLHFYMNNKKTFLRGKHDGMIFPLTGATPTEVEEWIRILLIAKSYGINHYRYHTCCPPEAAFVAANVVGIYMQPEIPFWGTLADVNEEGYQEKEQEFLIKEGERILETYGNHPSFVMMSLGNELWGSSKRMGEIIAHYKEIDSRHLYTEGSNNFQFTPVILEEDDFYVGVRFSKNRLIRGSYAMCDAPLGFVQTEEPNSVHTYDEHILPERLGDSETATGEIEIQYGTGTKKVKAEKMEELIPTKPVVSHEIGQYAVFPNFKETKKYSGPLKARNFEVFKENFEKAGFGGLEEAYFINSGKLAVECYKLELEAAHRSKYMAGYQILDIQDFSGQGTALVGILDAFMDSKGLITPERWRNFCNDAVIMAGFDSFNVVSATHGSYPVTVSDYRKERSKDAVVEYTLSCGDTEISKGEFSFTMEEQGVATVGEMELFFPEIITSTLVTVTLLIKGTEINNSYEIYVHPAKEAQDETLVKAIEGIDREQDVANTYCINGELVYITASLVKAEELLEQGEKVLLLPTVKEEMSLEGHFCTDFWNYPMFKSISEWMKKPVPVGTMGLLIDNEHEALHDFVSKSYATPQWYHIVMASRVAILDQLSMEYFPIVQMMDNFERNHKLGLLFEGKVKQGRLLICTSKLETILKEEEVVQFAKSVITYMASSAFKPRYQLTMEELRELFV